MSLEERYEILKELGAGAMGRVILARDRELGREVAVKTLAKHYLENAEVRQRFAREARVQAGVQHPNVVQLYDQDLEAPEPYLVMEFVAGRDLESLVKESGLVSLAGAIRLARELGGALDALHAGGIIHRDLKPANIMVRDRDGSGVVMDLGLASQEDSTVLTRTGALVGTPYYMPPELLTGASRWVPASDQYQLALILFEIMTGLKWIPGKTLETVSAAIAHGDRTPWPEGLDAITAGHRAALLRGARVDPGERYPSCAALAEAFAAGDPGDPAPPPVPEDPTPPVFHSAGFDPLTASTLADSAPAPRARGIPPAVLGLVVLVAGLYGLLGGPAPPPEDVRWQVLGDALVVSFRDDGREDLRLHVGEAVLTPGPARADGRRRCVFRGLGEEPAEAWLAWDGGATARSRYEADRPAVRDRAWLAPDRRLEVTALRRVRVGFEPGDLAEVEAGVHNLPLPGDPPWTLAWEEEEVRFTRALPFDDVLADTLQRLRALDAEVDPEAELLRRNRARGFEGKSVETERAPWRGLAPWMGRIHASALPREDRLWIWRTFETWALTVAQERSFGDRVATFSPPEGAPAERRFVDLAGARKEHANLWPAGALHLELEPVGGYSHEEESYFSLASRDAKRINTDNYQSAADALLFRWPATPAGASGDPWLSLRLSSWARMELLAISARDPAARDATLSVRVWHPSPTARRDMKESGMFHVRLPAALLPEPGTVMQVELGSILPALPPLVRVRGIALHWPGS